MSRRMHWALSGVGVALMAAGFLLQAGMLVSSAREPSQSRAAVQPVVKPAPAPPKLENTLGGKDRYLLHVSTDKPIYKAGEKVYVRAVALNAHDRKPLPANRHGGTTSIKITGPKGETVAQGNTSTQDSVAGYAWEVPAGQAGGEYTVVVTNPMLGLPPSERKFDIRAYRAPRLKSQIEFVRDGYGAGDTVSASVKVERAEGGIPVDAKVNIQARVDGRTVYTGSTVIDPTGIASTRFELPAEIARGEGMLAFVIQDGGVVETATKTIPILLQTVDLQFYPEGGDLIAGLPNRVYIAAKTPADKPADLEGNIVDSSGKSVADFRTEHEGRGRASFTPAKDETYSLKITKPSGIKKLFALPKSKAAGTVISSAENVFAHDAAIKLSVATTTAQKLTVRLTSREREVATKTIDAKAGETAELSLAPEDADGILIATVLDADGKPLAERLVFRQPAENLNVEITADRERYTPGSTAKITIKTTTADGKPVGAVVGLTVTDDSIREMLETRDQPPLLPAIALLENDVKELADAQVYLDANNPEAPLALDLLLGTQGWRRFAFFNTSKFIAANGDDAKRALALSIRRFPRPMMMLARGGGIAKNMAVPRAAPGAVEAAPQAGNDKAEAPDDPASKAAAPAKRPVDAGKKQDGQAQPGNNKPGEGKPNADFEKQAARKPGFQPGEPEPEAEGQRDLRQAVEQADQNAAADRLFADDIAASASRAPGGQWVVVREYAHKVRPDRQPNDRVDFTETLYWHAGLKTDDKTGIATVEFDLSDSVTGFRVQTEAFNADGDLTASDTLIESVEPFYVEPKLPLEVTSGDVIKIPLSAINGTSEPLSNVQLSMTTDGIGSAVYAPFVLNADERVRRLATLKVGEYSGETTVVLTASTGPFSDRVTRPLVVKPIGFPVELAKGGMLQSDDKKSHTFTVPATVVPGSLKTTATVFPTPLASMSGVLESLIRQPNGCFEQTSSTTYPLVMAQQYFQSHSGVDPDLIARSNKMLDAGYKRLVGYECKGGGYEWFGADPGHEALTAYGLMEFTDMAEVYNVDGEMLQRTRKWLLGQRDGKGGYKRERRALHTWVVDADISNAYITWALLSAGETDLQKEIDTVAASIKTTKNTYVKALAANVLAMSGQKEATLTVLDELFKLQQPDGSLSGATGSIVGSGGEALTIETTALATLAWLSDPDYIDFANKGVKYLASACKSGRFGNTQSTVLALKAIVAYDKSMAHPKADGSLQLLVDGKPVGAAVPFTKTTQGKIELPDFASLLTPGEHTIAVQMTDGSSMPYAVTVDLYSKQPASSKECAVTVSVKLNDAELTEGDVTEAVVKVTNTKAEAVPTPVAIIGLPGGLEVNHDRLKELVKEGQIAAYEVLGREVILYWRELKANEEAIVPVSVIAQLPGDYTAPASRAYLYYTDEHKQWHAPLSVTIEPLAQK